MIVLKKTKCTTKLFPHFLSNTMRFVLSYFLFLPIFCYLSSTLSAQNGAERNHWIFGGNAGLDFSSGNAVPINTYPFYSTGGCAVISNSNGNLLFFTNGLSIYDANQNQMPNGDSLWGHDHSTQSSVIVPHPSNSQLYYVFTTPHKVGMYNGSNFSGYTGLAYSLVDMNLNGGLGDVSVKNVPLLDSVTEKLTAVKHCNGIDYWVICHEWNTDAYYAYLVTALGV
jgi:hypothetical protein